MITGAHGAQRQPVRRQKLFFEKHITPWHARCMDDIRRAGGANFYRQVADFIEAFFSVESQAFDMEEALP
jgi:TorA maturation chaperone TorD